MCASRAASPRRRTQGPRKRRRATQDSGQVALEEGPRGAVIAGRSCAAACAQSSRWGHFKIVTQTIVPFWAFSDWVTAEDLRGPKLGSAPLPAQCTRSAQQVPGSCTRTPLSCRVPPAMLTFGVWLRWTEDWRTRAPLSTTSDDHARSGTVPLAHAPTDSFLPMTSPLLLRSLLPELPAETLPLVYCQPATCPALC